MSQPVLHLIVASRNPVKLDAVRRAASSVLPEHTCHVSGVAVRSGVADQPRSDHETHCGARQRARAARQERPDADYWIGLEGGVEDDGDDLLAFAWVSILGSSGAVGRARSAAFLLPPAVAILVRSGVELGEADDRVFGRSGSKQQEGAVGLLTDGRLSRTDLYAQAVELAWIPFQQPGLFPVR